jgi:threonyl-tRNA synthetase
MNCLFHMLIYKSKLRSYRDCRYAISSLEWCIAMRNPGCSMVSCGSTVYRMMRISIVPRRLHQEIRNILDFVIEVMGMFGFS